MAADMTKIAIASIPVALSCSNCLSIKAAKTAANATVSTTPAPKPMPKAFPTPAEDPLCCFISHFFLLILPPPFPLQTMRRPFHSEPVNIVSLPIGKDQHRFCFAPSQDRTFFCKHRVYKCKIAYFLHKKEKILKILVFF